MTPKWNECPSDSYRGWSSHENEKKDGNVYKRRKMDNDSNSLEAHEEAKEMAPQSYMASDNHSSLPLSVVPSDATFLTAEPRKELTSARDLCIAILRKDGQITESQTRITSEESIDCDANLLACNICGSLEHPLKMLICDSCEAAFHLSCCIPCIKKLPADEWYCAPCLRKKPKSLYGKLSEGKVKSSRNMDRRPHGMSHIEFMFKDTEPYVTAVRIGRDFQAEVPEWSGPTFSDGYFEAPSVLDPAELTKSNRWKANNQNRSIGNWIKCREVLNTGNSDETVVCGKWRRAPLYVVQSDDWDCSCCLPWDPAHADCAVPQELHADEVLKQLKYVNMLKNRMVKPA